MKRFAGKCVLVTGGSRGIGRETVLAFARQGAWVAYSYRHNTERAEDLDAELRDLAIEHRSFLCPVQDYAAVGAMIKEIVADFGGLDILVNNAGVLAVGAFAGMHHADYRDMIDTNLHGLFNVTKQALPHLMKNKSGAVVNVSSFMAYRPVGPGQAVYAATKAGIIGFTRSLAHECAKMGVRVNAVAPGLIETDMLSPLGDKVLEGIQAKTGVTRLGLPAEIAQQILNLAADDADFITGQTLVADGGASSFQF